MTVLSDDALEFARRHLSQFYDSDFFPRSFVFDALWHSWDEVKKELGSKNVGKLSVGAMRALPTKKPGGAYRIVHRLEPLDSIVYTALVWTAAPDIENARAPIASNIACSYRIAIKDGTFFGAGNGYKDFQGTVEAYSLAYEAVLIVDIADFFNQIYVHRIQNAIEAANPALKALSGDIERFLMSLRAKLSKGIPVGPAASILLSEAILADVDTFLAASGVVHTRYVDDYRIFGHTESELSAILESLTAYLYSQHLLSVASDKTKILPTAQFLNEHLHSKVALEKLQYINSLEVFNDYSGDTEEFELTEEQSEEMLTNQLLAAIEYLVALPSIDLGIARRVYRLGRRHKVAAIAGMTIANIDRFLPVIREVVLYLQAVVPDNDAQKVSTDLVTAVTTGVHKGRLGKLWLDWFLASLPSLHHLPAVSHHMYNSADIENRALAAMWSKNLPWIRSQKATWLSLGPWERWAVINAARALPSGERTPWLQHAINNAPTVTDRWVARWVLDTA